ncbi:hypothetical protein VN97_g415 [Penicillium thymicola]|uniref:Uncharacterized protein n=1 Tax=Penicillium thymicola TaxID=293382 RepID=A0AAI9XD69_PENTH|nr:hypothetical protein VN97_g415 [Penicillium thymicola]
MSMWTWHSSMRIILRLQAGTARRTPTKQETALEETLDSTARKGYGRGANRMFPRSRINGTFFREKVERGLDGKK